MASNWLTGLHSANFSNYLQQKITKIEPMNLLWFLSFSLPNPCLDQTWKDINTKFRSFGKDWEIRYQVKQILAPFCKLVAVIFW